MKKFVALMLTFLMLLGMVPVTLAQELITPSSTLEENASTLLEPTTELTDTTVKVPQVRGMKKVLKSIADGALSALGSDIYNTIFDRTDPYSEALDGIASQLYDVQGDVDVVLENTESIMTTMDEVKTTMGRLEGGIAELKRLIQQGFGEQALLDIIKKLEDVHSRIDPLWESYNQLCAEARDPNSEVYKDKAVRDKRIADFMTNVKNTYGTGRAHTFQDDLNQVYVEMSGKLPIGEAQITVSKTQYPFEHQIYDEAADAFKYGAALQAMLLQLYWDYSTYEQNRLAADPTYLMDPQCKEENYLMTGNTTIDRLNEECENPPHYRLLSPDDLDTTLYLTDGSAVEAWKVKSNDSGLTLAIAKKPLYMSNIAYSGQYRTKDGNWMTPQNIDEYKQVFAADITNPADWLRNKGGLAIPNHVDCFTIGPKRTTNLPNPDTYYDKIQFAQATTGSAVADSIFSINYATLSTLSNTPVYFATRGASIDPNGAFTLPIFINRSEADEATPIDSNGAYKPTKVSQLPKMFNLKDAVLDLTALTEYKFSGHQINVEGNARIIGGNKKLSNLSISQAGSSHLTLEDLTLTAGDDVEGALVSRGRDAQLHIIGTVSLNGIHSGLHVTNGASLFMFGNGTDQSIINLSGQYGLTHLVASKGYDVLEAQNLTMNIDSSDGYFYSNMKDTDSQDQKNRYFKNCVVHGNNPVNTNDPLKNSLAGTYEYCKITTASDVARVYAYCTPVNNGTMQEYVFYSQDKSYAGTKDNLKLRYTGMLAGGTKGSTEWLTIGAIDRDDTVQKRINIPPSYALGVEDYIEVKKDGKDGVKLSGIWTLSNSTPEYKNEATMYNGITFDDNNTHILYPVSPNYRVPYTQHNFVAERVGAAGLSTAANELSMADIFSEEAQWQRRLEKVASLSADETAHIPVILNEPVAAKPELFRALTGGDGKLSFDVLAGDNLLASWIFNASNLNIPAETLNTDLHVGTPAEMGHTYVPTGSKIVDFMHSGSLPGLTEIVLYNNNVLNFEEGQVYSLYRLENGAMRRVATNLKVNAMEDLHFKLDQCSTYALVYEGTLPATGDTTSNHFPSLWLFMTCGSALGFVFLWRKYRMNRPLGQ